MPRKPYFIEKVGDAEKMVQLYVHENFSLANIALQFGCSPAKVMRVLDRLKIERREKTSTRWCWCGADAEKKLSRRKAFFGTLCRKHRLEKDRKQQTEQYAARMNLQTCREVCRTLSAILEQPPCAFS